MAGGGSALRKRYHIIPPAPAHPGACWRRWASGRKWPNPQLLPQRHGRKGFRERARVSGERPLGAARCREQYHQASCQPPPPPPTSVYWLAGHRPEVQNTRVSRFGLESNLNSPTSVRISPVCGFALHPHATTGTPARRLEDPPPPPAPSPLRPRASPAAAALGDGVQGPDPPCVPPPSLPQASFLAVDRVVGLCSRQYVFRPVGDVSFTEHPAVLFTVFEVVAQGSMQDWIREESHYVCVVGGGSGGRGPMGGHSAFWGGGGTARCARAVRKVGHLGLFSPMAKVIAVTTVFPDTGLLRFLLSPKAPMMN